MTIADRFNAWLILGFTPSPIFRMSNSQIGLAGCRKAS
jgi:hypothetical protein